jgi:hypothetical protein
MKSDDATPTRGLRRRPRRCQALVLAGVVALVMALSDLPAAAAVMPAVADAGEHPAAKRCVGAEEASARDGDEDEGAPPKFSSGFYTRTFTLDASLDGLDGKQLPISIEEVCDVPKALTNQAAELAGTDGIALLSAPTSVWADETPLQGDAAVAALDGADTAVLRVRLAPRRRWAEDEDGDEVPTFTARRITITD